MTGGREKERKEGGVAVGAATGVFVAPARRVCSLSGKRSSVARCLDCRLKHLRKYA